LARSQLREKSSKSLELSDGEIYRIYRIYINAQDERQAAKWWARLGTDHRRKWFKRLQKKAALFKGFESLLQFSGLWKPLNSSQIERMIKLDCPEVSLQ
jgi:hypothetical protein